MAASKKSQSDLQEVQTSTIDEEFEDFELENDNDSFSESIGKKQLQVKDESDSDNSGSGGKDEVFTEEGELAVDVFETESELVIQAAIAGIKAEDLDVSIEDDLVTISGERRNPEPEAEKTYYHQECFWGPFSREIIIPEEVDTTGAEASMKNNIFTLRIPKAEKEQTKKIRVKKTGT